jgi:AraC-like DNA-binding protein
MDYLEFCKTYYIATHIPVTLSEGKRPLYSSGVDLLDVEPSGILDTDLVLWEGNPAFCRRGPDMEYGRVLIEGTDLNIILGPLMSTEVTEQLVQAYIVETALPSERRDDIRDFLYSIPLISHFRFACHLNLIHMCVNGKTADLDELYGKDAQSDILLRRSVDRAVQLEDAPCYTWRQEQKMLQLIKMGDVDALKKLLKSFKFSMAVQPYAGSPLRQVKDLFIVAVTKAGTLGAIPGGADADRVCQLSGMYIRECEKLQTIESVYRLLFSMLQDFCRITGDSKVPENLSADVYACVNYIRTHTNEPIGVGDVARAIGRSESCVIRHFKQEMGISVGSYITECKLEQAKSLLRYTGRSLAEISCYLSFSSQPYFQNVFKKRFHITPANYRRQCLGTE